MKIPRARFWLLSVLLVLVAIWAVPIIATAMASGRKEKPGPDKVYGRIQYVTSFPDVKVRVVKSFGDLRVQVVNAFADEPGEWEIVDSFPDFKVEIVKSLEDFTIEYVNAFPGVREKRQDD